MGVESMRYLPGLFFSLVLISVADSSAAVERLPVEAFALPPNHANVRISPGGRYVAAKLFMGGQYILIVYDLENLDQRPFMISTDNEEVSWLRWANNDRLLVSIRFASRGWGTPTIETRLVAINADGSRPKALVKPEMNRQGEVIKLVQIQDNIVDMLPDDPNHVLIWPQL